MFFALRSELMSTLFQDMNQTSRRGGTTTIWDSGVGGLSSSCTFATQLEGEKAEYRMIYVLSFENSDDIGSCVTC